MKKLKLDLDDLKVESFETTTETAKSGGTVLGYGLTANTAGSTCELVTCLEPCGRVTSTCHGTCGSTCGNTCLDTCGTTCGGTCGGTDPDTSWLGCNLSLPC